MLDVLLVSTDAVVAACGPRMISAALKSAGHRVSLVNLIGGGGRNPLEYPDVFQRIRQMAAESDLVGVSCTAYAARDAASVADLGRQLGKPVVWGGIHATMDPEMCLRHADIVCVGEGEEAAAELAQALDAGADTSGIANLWVKSNGGIRRNPLRPLVRDLDRLPSPDYDPATEWVRDGRRLVPIAESGFHPEDDTHTQALVHTTRGCAMNCSYCLNSALRGLYAGCGPYVRRHGAARAVDMTKAALQANPRAASVWFTDDDFFLRRLSEVEEFCALYRAEVGVPFEVFTSPETLTEEKVRAVVEAGCYRVRMGIQSGSERSNREVYGRPITNDKVLAGAAILHRYSGRTSALFNVMMNNPYEMEEDVRQTIALVSQLPPPFYLRVYGLVFIPGTEIYRRAMREHPNAISLDSAALGFFVAARLTNRGSPYLNFLLSQMSGRASAWRVGGIPRRLIGPLSSRPVVRFHDSRPGLFAFYRRGLAALRQNDVARLIGSKTHRPQRPAARQ